MSTNTASKAAKYGGSSTSNPASMPTLVAARAAEIAVLSFILILANLRAFIIWPLFPDASHIGGLAWLEIALWSGPLVGIGWLLTRQRRWAPFLEKWKENWLLLLFIAVAGLSIFGSVSPPASLYRFLCMLFATISGAWLGVRYDRFQIPVALFWIGAVTLLLSVAVAVFEPVYGRALYPPYNGAWRGIFWNRNHLGNLLALFNAIFLLTAIRPLHTGQRWRLVSFTFYVLSAAVLYLARSASGLIVAILLNSLVLAAAAWLPVRHRLRRKHYYAAGLLAAVASMIVLVNLDFVFGLFGRDTTLTGRTALWAYLLEDVFVESPWLGHGFGAIWTLESFRVSTQQVVGWGNQVVIGDNGLLDILLHTGVVGLVIAVAVIGRALARSFTAAIHGDSLVSFVPLSAMIHLLLANMAFSLLLETESFVWLLMVVWLFTDLKSTGLPSSPPTQRTGS